MNFNQAYTATSLEDEKELIRFFDLDPICKVPRCHRMMNNPLSAFYRLNAWINFNQTCTISHREIENNLSDFGDLNRILRAIGVKKY